MNEKKHRSLLSKGPIVFLLGAACSLAACTSLLGDFTINTEQSSDGGIDAPVRVDGSGDAPSSADSEPDAPTGPAHASFDQTSIDFGFGDCGLLAALPKVLKITNSGGQALTYSAVIGASAFSISGKSSGTVPPNGSADLVIAATPVSSGANAGDIYSATLTVVTNDQTQLSTDFAVKMTARGATFTATPAAAKFGSFPNNAQAPDIGITITNTGNAPASVGFSNVSSGDLSFDWNGSPTAVVVQPQASVPKAAAHFHPTSLVAQDTFVGVNVTGAVCGTSVTRIEMSGQGTASIVGISPSQLDYTLVNCGSQGGTQYVTITNTGNVAAAWSANLSLGAASPYGLSAASGSVPANSFITIGVTPTAIPAIASTVAGAFNDSLNVFINGVATQSIALLETAQGAVLKWSGADYAFTSTPIGSTQTMPSIAVTNNGNASVTLSFTTIPVAAPFSASPSSFSVAGGSGTQALSATFTPLLTIVATAQATLAYVSGPICSAIPAAIKLSGSGTCPPNTAMVSFSTPANFQIEATEVTNAQYSCFLQNSAFVAAPPFCSWNSSYTPSANWPPSAGQMPYPVANVNWCDAFVYCKTIGRNLCGAISGGPVSYTAPATGAKWTSACSANGTYAYEYGNTFDKNACNVSEKGIGGTVPVGSLATCTGPAAPENTLFDMSGNVFEWIDSCNANTGATDQCNMMGGAYDYSQGATTCTSAGTPAPPRNASTYDVGFRCCN